MNDYIKAIILFFAVSLVLGVVVVSAVNMIDGREIFSTQVIGTISNANNAGAVNTDTAKTATAINTGNVQTATLKVVGGNYVLTPSVFKKGVPIKITADIANMPGCSKSFTIPDFNIRKSLTNNDNIIEFTPDRSGTFRMACTMNMYTGTITITDDGNAPTGAAAVAAQQVASKPSNGGSCGAGGGGCGCGG